MRRVVVTGIGIVSSIGTGQDEVAASLREAKSGVQHAADHAAHGFRSQVWAPPSLGVTAEDMRVGLFQAAQGPGESAETAGG